MRRLTVRSVMTSEVVTVAPETPFTTIARVLTEHRLNAAPVIDAGGVRGVVSVGDLLHKEGHRHDPEGTLALTHRARVSRRKAAGTVAAELMSTPAVVTRPDTTVVDAARIMARRQVKQLPVVDDTGGLVGIVSRTDLVRAFLRPDDEIRQDVESGLREGTTTWSTLDHLTVDVHDGVATLSGMLERRTDAELAERIARHVDGVADVRSGISYRIDDTVQAYPTF